MPVRSSPFLEHAGLVAVVVGAGVVGALAPVEPTASGSADVALAALFAGGLALLASRAERWSWFAPATAAGALGATPWMWVGIAALLVAIGASWLPERPGLLGALVGGASAQALLRLPDWDPFGTSAVVVAIVVLPVVVSGLRGLAPGPRRVVLGGLALTTVAVGALGAVAGVVVLGQRGDVEAGIDVAERGLDAAEQGDDAVAVDLLDEAADTFTSAQDALDVPWLAPARAVPVLGQHLEALDAVSGEGAELARLAGESLVEADVDSLRFEDGRIDIDRLRAIEPPLERSATGLAGAERTVGDLSLQWLLGPVRSRVERFERQVSDAAADADVALDALRVAPGLFGGDGDRRYFVIFTTPAEARGLGGFIGNYGELTAVDGDLELTRSGRLANELGPPEDAPYELTGPDDYLDHYSRFEPGEFIQDTSFSPDFPSVAEVWEQLYPQVPGGGDLDGVIMVDPFGLAGLLEFTGPITVTGRAEPLTADNAATFLLQQQYLEFGTEERVDYLDEASRLTFEALTSGDIPGPQPVIDVLGPLVRGGNLALTSVHEAERDLFARTGIDGAIPRVVGDFAGLTGQNAGNSKIDIFSQRSIDYAATVDPGKGTVRATATIVLGNDAPTEGLPSDVLRNGLPGRAPGTNSSYLTWYSALALDSMTVQGFDAAFETYRELGRNAYSRLIDVPAGEEYTVVLELSGPYRGDLRYRLDLARQPTVVDDRVSVSISPAPGWAIVGVDGAGTRRSDVAVVEEQPMTQDLILGVDFTRSG